MDPVDKQIFFLDIGPLNWEEYFQNTILGVREYLSKEPPKNLEAARRKDRMLVFLKGNILDYFKISFSFCFILVYWVFMLLYNYSFTMAFGNC